MKSARDIGIDENHPLYKAIDRGGGQTCDIGGVIQALLDAGYVIVPREPTEAMLYSPAIAQAKSLKEEYQAMIDAALKAY